MVTGQPASTRKRFWFDPRFAVGLVLVAASVVGVGAIVQTADRSIAVYAAGSPLAVGDMVTAADLVSVPVRFPGAGDLYLTPVRLPRDGLIVTRTIAAGELVATSAVGRRAGASVTSVVVDVRGALAESITAGSEVDVWASRPAEGARFAPPVVLVAAASVVRLRDVGGLIASESGMSVEILVPKAKVAAVLESIANRDAIALVPVHAALAD
ncbi:MAG: hypothetical protein JWQ59_616 [Cryobacterium sp.]|jgi:hypothetical protein|nr:hypothetical protein [Cryobacterium sp.]